MGVGSVQSEFLLAIKQIEREREIPPEEIQAIIEDAITRAIQQESEEETAVRVEFDAESGRLNIFQIFEVVEEVQNPNLEIAVSQALKMNDEVQVGDEIELPMSLRSFRRIGIQTVKQHIMQRVRDLERYLHVERFNGKENQIITGVVSRITSRGVFVNLDRIDGILPESERIPGERYMIGKRIKVLVSEIKTGPKEAEIILSRSHPDFVRRLFELEVPEITQSVVLIKGIVREAGYRTKMAVMSTQDKVDPVGACVGYKGSRVKNIVNELNGEKIDIIPWDEDPTRFIAHALSPAQVISVEVFDDIHSAEVVVPDSQLSLAIGKQGQNARLANKLTTWKIDILSESEKDRFMHEQRIGELYTRPIETIGLVESFHELLKSNGIITLYNLICLSDEDLLKLDGVTEGALEAIKLRISVLGGDLGLKLREADEPAPVMPASALARNEQPVDDESPDTEEEYAGDDDYDDEDYDDDEEDVAGDDSDESDEDGADEEVAEADDEASGDVPAENGDAQ